MSGTGSSVWLGASKMQPRQGAADAGTAKSASAQPTAIATPIRTRAIVTSRVAICQTQLRSMYE